MCRTSEGGMSEGLTAACLPYCRRKARGVPGLHVIRRYCWDISHWEKLAVPIYLTAPVVIRAQSGGSAYGKQERRLLAGGSIFCTGCGFEGIFDKTMT